MKNLIMLMAGLLIATFDERVQMSIIPINVVTDIVGYALVIWGLTGLITWSPCFKRARTYAVLAMISTLGIRVVNYFGIEYSADALTYGLAAIFYIYTTYYVLEGIMVKNKTEKITEPNANLKGAWMALSVAQFLYSICYLTDIGGLLENIGLGGLEDPIKSLFGAAAFATNAFFVIMLNQVRMLLFPKQEDTQ